MIKKRSMTNRLYGANGGWAAIREVKYNGIAKVYGMEYHEITPIISSGEWNEMVDWCINIYGPSGTKEKPGSWSPGERWYVNNARFWFREKKDCEWFLLRFQ
jgi:hypothetical protein